MRGRHARVITRTRYRDGNLGWFAWTTVALVLLFRMEGWERGSTVCGLLGSGGCTERAHHLSTDLTLFTLTQLISSSHTDSM
jgi:hypothetical protein